MRRLSMILLICLFAGASLWAQSLLPGGFAGWTPGQSTTYTPGQWDQLSPGNAHLLRELGLEGAEGRTYHKDGALLTVTVLQFRDPTGVYGAYRLERSLDLSPIELTELASASDNHALIAFANLLLKVDGTGLSKRQDDLKALLEAAKPHAKREAGPFPNLVQYMPPGALKGSRRFALGPLGLENLVATGKGDWVGFDMGAEIESARYTMPGREATLLLVSYPTPQVAMAREKALSRWFNVNLTEDKVEGRPVIFTRRMTSLLAILVNSQSQKESEGLLGRVNYRTELTWNEPSYVAKDPPWGLTLYRIFLGTFLFVGLGIAVGLCFAGFRLLMKRLFPGKIFDRPESIEILQLGLGSKPIEGKDFYQ